MRLTDTAGVLLRFDWQIKEFGNGGRLVHGALSVGSPPVGLGIGSVTVEALGVGDSPRAANEDAFRQAAALAGFLVEDGCGHHIQHIQHICGRCHSPFLLTKSEVRTLWSGDRRRFLCDSCQNARSSRGRKGDERPVED